MQKVLWGREVMEKIPQTHTHIYIYIYIYRPSLFRISQKPNLRTVSLFWVYIYIYIYISRIMKQFLDSVFAISRIMKVYIYIYIYIIIAQKSQRSIFKFVKYQ